MGAVIYMFMQLSYASVCSSAGNSVCRAVRRVEMQHVLDSLYMHGTVIHTFMQLSYASIRSSASPAIEMGHTSSHTDATCGGRQFCLPGGAICRSATRPRLTVHAWESHMHVHATDISIRPFVCRDAAHILMH